VFLSSAHKTALYFLTAEACLPFDFLMTTQMDALYKQIETSGMRAGDFELQMVDGLEWGGKFGSIPAIVDKANTSTFAISKHGEYYHATYKPGARELIHRSINLSWTGLLMELRTWLASLRREAAAPDYWKQLQSERDALASVQGSEDNSRFSPDEQSRIGATLEKILSEIEEQKILNAMQFTALQVGMDEMKRAATRMGRKDWVLLVIGTLVTFSITATVAPGDAHIIYQTTASALNWLSSAVQRAIPPTT
jgi:hypothetical protein